MRFVTAVCCAAALVAFSASSARADEWNKKTILTFSGPVQIPGATLAPGTYVFKLADLASNRHVVQVFDKDEKKIYATILAIPDTKLEPSDEPVVLFAERPAGMPTAVKAWFYPGDTIGNEFVYPKNQAMRIARDTHQSVLAMEETSAATTTDAERMDSMKSAKVSRVDERGTSTAYPTEQSPEAAPATTAGATSTASPDSRLKNSSGNARVSSSDQTVGTSGQASDTAQRGRRTLPRTASDMTLIQLLGGLSLAGGLGIRRLREKFANAR